MRRGAEKLLICCGVPILLIGAGCGPKDEGTEVTEQDAAAIRAKAASHAEEQIASIEKDPNMPPAQKAKIIATIKAGMARAAAGAKAGQAGAAKK
ncbi:MAG: hypothetical protein QM758_08540 [Armatimonas sp.]